MALVRQLTTAGFRPISRYEYIVRGSQSVKETTTEVYIA